MRKRAIVYINENEIAEILKLPDGLRVVAVNADFPRTAIGVMIEGDQLADTEPGTVLPEYEVTRGGRWLPAWKSFADGYREGFEARLNARAEEHE